MQTEQNDSTLTQFLKLFPEYTTLNNEVKNDIDNLGTTVYRYYSNYYFKHQKDKRYPDDIFDAIKAINLNYRNDLERVGGDRSRLKTDAGSISYFLVTKYPFDKLVKLIGYKENTNRKEAREERRPVREERRPVREERRPVREERRPAREERRPRVFQFKNF
jgi:hypothetical protein